MHGTKNSRVTAGAETDGDYVVIPVQRIRTFLDRNPTLNAKILKNMMAAMDVHLEQFKGDRPGFVEAGKGVVLEKTPGYLNRCSHTGGGIIQLEARGKRRENDFH